MDEKITVYVKSSALGQTGIYWQNATKGEKLKENLELLKQPITLNKRDREAPVDYLIIETEKSLVLLRFKKKLLLQVTGFESPERTEQMGRPVFNSFALVVDDDDNKEGEARIRYIAAKVLDDVWRSENLKLQEIVNQAVTFDGKEAFKVNLDEINQFTQGKVSQRDSAPDQFDRFRIQNISNDEIEKLINDLKNQKFPEQWKSWDEKQGSDAKIRDEGVLVIVTNWLPDPGILHKAGVWRGLAGHVAEPEKKILPAPVPEPKPEPEPTHDNQTQKKETPSNNSLGIVVAVVVGVVIVGAAIWFLTRPPKEPVNPSIPTTPPETENNPQQEEQQPAPSRSPEIETNSQTEEQLNPAMEEAPLETQINPQVVQPLNPAIVETNPQAEEQLNPAVEEAPLETEINPQVVQPLNPAIVETNPQAQEQLNPAIEKASLETEINPQVETRE